MALSVVLSVIASLLLLAVGSTAQLSCASGLSPITADIVFLVDASSSMSAANFSSEIAGLTSYGTALIAGAPSSRIAVAQYASTPCLRKGFCTVSPKFVTGSAALTAALASLRYLGTSNNIGAALQYANDQYLPFARVGVSVLVVVFTAGVTADVPDAALATLVRAGASVQAVAVGLAAANLRNVTSSPQQTVEMASFAALEDAADAAALFSKMLCPGGPCLLYR